MSTLEIGVKSDVQAERHEYCSSTEHQQTNAGNETKRHSDVCIDDFTIKRKNDFQAGIAGTMLGSCTGSTQLKGILPVVDAGLQ